MNVTIQDAINAFALLKEHVNENGFLYECYNLGISALKTIQDGDYHIQTDTNSQVIKAIRDIANYNCDGESCNGCKYSTINSDIEDVTCLSCACRELLRIKEIKKWIQENYL